MDFQKLKHLLAVVEHGTFSRAADKVNLSQPALSRSIQALEAELGLPLLDRGTRQVRLTPYGACVAERARRMRYEEAELRRELKTLAGGESGTLSIGLSPTPASLLLTPFLAHMATHHPQVRVAAELGATAALLEQLRAERIDAMVCDARMLYGAADIETRPLAPLRAGMVCRKHHPILAHRRPTIDHIRRYPVASSTLSPEVALRLAETLGPAGAPGQMVTVRCENLAPPGPPGPHHRYPAPGRHLRHPSGAAGRRPGRSAPAARPSTPGTLRARPPGRAQPAQGPGRALQLHAAMLDGFRQLPREAAGVGEGGESGQRRKLSSSAL